MDLGLAGNVVVIFGAARGIGLAITRGFAAEGAVIAAIDRDPSVHDLAGSQGQVQSIVADVTDYTSVRQVAHDVERRLGRIDHLVFAVGVGSGKFGFPFWKLEPADWEFVLKVNLIGAVNVAHAFGPAMAAAAQAASDAGHYNRPRVNRFTLDALSLLGRRPDRLANRPSLQRRQGRPDQFRPVCRQGSCPVRCSG